MTTDHIEKFVNAIACDLEEGGFRQVSGTTLRRSLTEAVSAALPLLRPAELAEQQALHRSALMHALADSFSAGAEGLQFAGDARCDALLAALTATGKQQVGEVRGDALCSELLAQANSFESMAAGDRETGESIEQAIEDGEGYTPDEPQDIAAGLQHDADRAEETAALLRKAAAALAARQPVGQEPVGEIDEGEEGRFVELYPDRELTLGAKLYTAPTAQAVDLGQLWEPIKEAVHTALSVHAIAMSQKKREQVAVYVARQLRDGQRDAAPGVGNG